VLDAVQAGSGLAALAPLAAELGALKRLRDARHPDSYASRLFRRAWGALAAGRDPALCASQTVADTLAAVRLGGIDRDVLQACGVEGEAADAVLRRGFDEVAVPLDPALRAELRPALGQAGGIGADLGPAPRFAEALIRQPRAGATCPGKPRIVLEPPEGHGDHCLIVAVLATIAAPRYGAPSTACFLAGMAHHLHNAVLPDSGFAGEVLLGEHLEPVLRRLFARELATLPGPLATTVGDALDHIRDASTPVGRAFHAADVMDRVLEMRHFAEVAAFTVDQALEEMELVHAGPVQAFHRAVLAEAGLP
jgi:hypothetical protein